MWLDIHRNPIDSYFLMVLPRILRFPGSDKFNGQYKFFETLVKYLSKTMKFHELKFHIRLMSRNYNSKRPPLTSGPSTYLSELEKLNKSMEPYRSIFHMESINLVSYDIKNGKIIDHRPQYYHTYVKQRMAKREINEMVKSYLVGIEWLYQYYITGKRMEWSGWFYNYSQPPLIDDIINYLENNPDCSNHLDTILKSYPENNMTPKQNYLYVTPNEYTLAKISPNLSDVIQLIDGKGAIYLNRCQIRWHEFLAHTKPQ